jgi:hypothetical protein
MNRTAQEKYYSIQMKKIVLLFIIMNLSILIQQVQSKAFHSQSHSGGTSDTISSGGDDDDVSISSHPSGYEIISDKTVFSRWRSIISRVVKMPNGNVVDYDVSER